MLGMLSTSHWLVVVGRVSRHAGSKAGGGAGVLAHKRPLNGSCSGA